MGALSLRVDFNTADVRRFVSGIEEHLRKDAIVPALNKTAAKVKTEVVRKIAKETKTQQKQFRKKIKIIKARKGSAKSRAKNFAVVDANDAKSINLIEYVRPSQRKVGFFNEIKKRKKGKKSGRVYRAKGVIATIGKSRRTYAGSFIGSSKGGGLRVFRRVGRRRDKITQVPGPSPANYFKRPETHQFMRRIANEHFPIELNRAAKMVIARQARKNSR